MESGAPPLVDAEFAFGPFRLNPRERLLTCDGETVSIGARAMQILLALVDSAAVTLSPSELTARAWPDGAAAVGSLRSHVGTLRRLLGDGQHGVRYIETQIGRGYCFVAPVARSATAKARPRTPSLQGLPPRQGRMVGRASEIRELRGRLDANRCVTIVGPGGIGKTSLALAVAQDLAEEFDRQVAFVDLGALFDSAFTFAALASAIGLPVHVDHPTRSLLAYLSHRRMLLIFDNCEHVIEPASALIESIVQADADIRILATSREALRIESEHVYRLGGLASPPAAPHSTTEDLLTYPAAQLFARCLANNGYPLEPSDVEARLVGHICRKVDGIPLALELAAGRAGPLGLEQTAALLDSRLSLAWSGRRTATARQQTLQATLDWSYALLPEPERLVLSRLSIFVGHFTLEAAQAVVCDGSLDLGDVVAAIDGLAAKSLIATERFKGAPAYRLLEVTRAYAMDRLAAQPETERLQVAKSHACYLCRRIETAQDDHAGEDCAKPAISAELASNLRAALDWAFSPHGDTSLGVRLTVAAIPFWTQMSLIDECRRNVERALSNHSPDCPRDELQDMKLYAALGTTLLNTTAMVAARAAWSSARDIARRLADVDYELRALWAIWTSHFSEREFRAALTVAQQFYDVAANSSDPHDRPAGDRMIGAVLYAMGDMSGARRHTERMLYRRTTSSSRADISRFVVDQKVQARGTLAVILWSQGSVDRARALVRRGTAQAIATAHTISICSFLIHSACPLAFFMGDLAECDRLTAMLREKASQAGMDTWEVWARCLQAVLSIRRGQASSGLRSLEAGLADIRLVPHHPRNTLLRWEAALALGATGEIGRGLAAIDETLAECERSEELWCVAELHRIRGEILRGYDDQDASGAAEHHFRTGIDWALRRAVPSWELRCVMSLGRLLRDQGRGGEARSALTATRSKFTEGFGSHDVIEARRLLAELS